jgi:hypothetical protein
MDSLQLEVFLRRMFKRLSSKAAGDGKTGGGPFSPARPELQSSSFPDGLR